MKKGVTIMNNARGAIMNTQAVADACSSSHIQDMELMSGSPNQYPRITHGATCLITSLGPQLMHRQSIRSRTISQNVISGPRTKD
uniref:Uncharacterized protein n=1 Tax=Triticum urartu TaxID=4572 RepID=A0A8R7V393_TRIUA